jgi:hypothetical protein
MLEQIRICELNEESQNQGRRNIPLHFKLFLGATVIYLGYRLYQGIEWLLHHL